MIGQPSLNVILCLKGTERCIGNDLLKLDTVGFFRDVTEEGIVAS